MMAAALSRHMPWSPTVVVAAAAALVRRPRREAHGRAERRRVVPRVQQLARGTAEPQSRWRAEQGAEPSNAARRKSMHSPLRDVDDDGNAALFRPAALGMERTGAHPPAGHANSNANANAEVNAEATVVTITAAALDTLGRTAIVWGDGHTSVFLNAWLRDHCRCPTCINQATGQRSLDSLVDLPSPAALTFSGAVVSEGTGGADDGGTVAITLSNAESGCKPHACAYPPAWLRSHCPAEQSRLVQGRRAAAAAAVVQWDAGSLIPAWSAAGQGGPQGTVTLPSFWTVLASVSFSRAAA